MPTIIQITREQYHRMFGEYPAPGCTGMALYGEGTLVAIYELVDNEIGDEIEFLEALYRL